MNMAPKELEVLFKEFFHAYMDYIAWADKHGVGASVGSKELLDFASREQVCHYMEVMITPVVQRVNDTELRFLTESELWEALNETWAVFVGWAIWNQLEIQSISASAFFQERKLIHQWMSRLEEALEIGELGGYYMPVDPDERRTARTRMLARASKITEGEVSIRMSHVLGFPDESSGRVKNYPGFARAGQAATTCR